MTADWAMGASSEAGATWVLTPFLLFQNFLHRWDPQNHKQLLVGAHQNTYQMSVELMFRCGP